MKNKKIIVICVIILVSIVLISILTYIFLKNGNTKVNKSEEDIIENILNINSYIATMEIQMETNKNNTRYVVKQVLDDKNISRQEVIEPKNIAGVVTEYDGNNLKITNNNLGLISTFENYNYIVESNLWLNSFIDNYREQGNVKVSQKNDEIVLKVKNEDGNKYNVYKELYIDKKTRKTY